MGGMKGGIWGWGYESMSGEKGLIFLSRNQTPVHFASLPTTLANCILRIYLRTHIHNPTATRAPSGCNAPPKPEKAWFTLRAMSFLSRYTLFVWR